MLARLHMGAQPQESCQQMGEYLSEKMQRSGKSILISSEAALEAAG